MEADCQNEVSGAPTVILDVVDAQVVSFEMICRICGNESDKNISIFGVDGQNNNLALKLNTYLPVKVTEEDVLPLSCCYNCTSTVLSWHELVITSIATDRRLKATTLFFERPEVEAEETINTDADTILPDSQNNDGVQASATSLTVFYQPPTTSESEIKNEEVVLKTEVEATPQQVAVSGDNAKSPRKMKDAKKESSNKSGNHDVVEVNCEKYNFFCDYCGGMFVTDEDILQHVKEEHPNEVDLSETELGTSQSSQTKDKRKHSKIDQEAVNAAKCVIDGRVYYNCKICSKSLYSPYTYLWHMRIHTGERPYMCDLCGKRFRVSQGLARHLRETHQGIKNFGCDLCGRMFSTRRNVQEHRRIHTNERPYSCSLCGKAFKQKASLFVHKRSHTDHFPFRCSYCNQGFRTKPPLLVHVTRHTGEKPYPCEVCGRYFRIKYELKRHMLVHSDEKPFTCEECGLSFRQKRYLKNHNKTTHNRNTD